MHVQSLIEVTNTTMSAANGCLINLIGRYALNWKLHENIHYLKLPCSYVSRLYGYTDTLAADTLSVSVVMVVAYNYVGPHDLQSFQKRPNLVKGQLFVAGAVMCYS